MLTTSPLSSQSYSEFIRIFNRIIIENNFNELIKLLQFPRFMETVVWIETDSRLKHLLIHHATVKRWNQIINLILQHYPEMLETKDKCERTPLYLAVELGDEDLVKYYISKGSDINVVVPIQKGQSDFNTPLYCAIKKGHYKVAAKLLKAGAHIKFAKKESINPNYLIDLFHIVVGKGWVDIARIFLALEASLVNSVDQFGKRPLMKAAAKGQIKMVDYLLEQGAREMINAPIMRVCDDYGKMAHHYAIEIGHVEVSKLLIKNKANLKATFGHDQSSAVHLAAIQGNQQILQAILEVNAQLIEYGDAYHRTPLLLATIYGHVKIIQYLISLGANLEAKINNPNDKKHNGLKALEYAKKNEMDDIALLLIEAEKVSIEKNIQTKKANNQDSKSLLFFQEGTYSFYIKPLLKKPDNIDIDLLNENGHLLNNEELQNVRQIIHHKNINQVEIEASKLKNNRKYNKNTYKIIKFSPDCFTPIYHGVRHGINSEGLALGKGGYATVKLGQLPNGEFIACKKSRLIEGANPKKMDERIKLENEILHKMNNGVGLYERPGLFKDYFIGMKLAPGKDLYENFDLELPDWRWLKFTEDLFTAIKNLHDKDYIHCDIKLENVMFNEFGEVNLIDFGLSLKVTQTINGEPIAVCKELRGSKDYLAPELHNTSLGIYSFKTDIYAAGRMLFLIFFNAHYKDLDAIISGKTKINYETAKFKNKSLCDDIFQYLQKLVDCDPKKRPSAVETIKFFRELRELNMSILQKIKTVGILNEEFMKLNDYEKQQYIKPMQLMDEIAIFDDETKSPRDLLLLQEFFQMNKIFARYRYIAKYHMSTLEKIIKFNKEVVSQASYFYISSNQTVLQDLAKEEISIMPLKVAPSCNECGSPIISQYNLFEHDYKFEIARISDKYANKTDGESRYAKARVTILQELLIELRFLYDHKNLNYYQFLILIKKAHHLLCNIEKSADTQFDTTMLLKVHMDSMLVAPELSDSSLANISIK